MDTSKTVLKVIFIVVLFREVQSNVNCRKYSDAMFCSEFTLLRGEHLEMSNENQEIKHIFLYNCTIASIPTEFFMNFTNAENIFMNHVGASMIEPDAFEGMIHLKKLGLSGNDIPELQADMFADLISLEELDLPFNKLIELKPDTFKTLNKLKFLDLSYNDIEHIHPDSFLSLNNLQCLNLSGNSLKELKPGIFDSLKNLAELEIDHVYMYTLQKDLFEGLTNLKYLSLQLNYIHELDANCFSNMPMLAHLKLGYNHLQHITAGVFASLSNLETLELNHNDLLTFSKTEVYGLTNLKRLYVNYNKLSHLNIENILPHLPNLKYVQINKNTWDCSNLKLTIDAFKKNHVNILDNYTKNQAHVDGIACREGVSEMDKISSETTPRQHITQLDTNSDNNINNNSYLGYDIKYYFEKFETEFKNQSARLMVINEIVLGISIVVIILLFALLGFIFYRRNTMKTKDNFSVRYNDVCLIPDYAD